MLDAFSGAGALLRTSRRFGCLSSHLSRAASFASLERSIDRATDGGFRSEAVTLNRLMPLSLGELRSHGVSRSRDGGAVA